MAGQNSQLTDGTDHWANQVISVSPPVCLRVIKDAILYQGRLGALFRDGHLLFSWERQASKLWWAPFLSYDTDLLPVS
jgi:hypothetical protein